MSNGQIITFSIFGGTGIAMMLFGLASFIRMRRFKAIASTTIAKVVAYKKEDSISTDDDSRNVKNTSYYPIVEFKDARGTQQRVELSSGGNPPKYSVGTAVTLLYDENNPNHAEIQSFAELWGLSIILTAMGTMFLFVAIIGWLFNIPARVNP